ncbi:MAG: phosphodiester glycosidase family protein [Clostridia bacterium]|nr:phosphodiester glycosidase family protein [Clostridia bacterium]
MKNNVFVATFLIFSMLLCACSTGGAKTTTEFKGQIVAPGLEESSPAHSPANRPSSVTEATKSAEESAVPSPPSEESKQPSSPAQEPSIPQNEEDLIAAVNEGRKSGGSYFDRKSEKVVASYFEDGKALLIREIVVGEKEDRNVCYIADLYLDNIKDLVGCVFMDEDGGVVKGSPQYVAEQLGAIFIVNTDFMRGRSWGLYIRGGHIFRDKSTKGIDVCCLRTDGRMEILDGDTLDSKALLAQGDIWHVLTFGPSLLNEDGSPRSENEGFRINDNYQGWNDDTSYYGFLSPNPRTAMGQAADGHYIFCVVDGRNEDVSRGMTFPELSHLMYEEGSAVAYNLDGGGSAMMYYNGKYVNTPAGGRDPSDYFCIIGKEN